MNVSSLHEASPDRLASIAAIRHEAHLHDIERDMAAELSMWGDFNMRIGAARAWELRLGNDGEQLTLIRFDNVRSMIESFIKDSSGKLRRTHLLPNIPASSARILEIDALGEKGMFKRRVLFLICDFGIMGNVGFGVSRDGSIHFQNNLNNLRKYT